MGSNEDKPLCDFFVQNRDGCHLGNYETNMRSRESRPRGSWDEVSLLLRDGKYRVFEH